MRLMSIISQLAKANTKYRGNSLAMQAAVLVAVVMLGTLLFIYSELEISEWKYHQELVGDFHVQLLGITFSEYEQLAGNPNIRAMEPSQGVYFEDLPFQRPGVVLYLESSPLFKTGFFSQVRSLEGRPPQEANEILVPDLFVLENPEYTLGSTITLGSKAYTISGIYKDHLYSFEKDYRFFGLLAFSHPSELFHRGDTIDVTIWFQNERDAYTLTRKILAELGRGDEEELLKEGAINYNTRYLEGKLIFQSGLIPSREFAERWSVRVFLLVCTVPLFIIMIRNAFNVWCSQDLRRIGLLKSCGMTPRQVRSMVIREALELSIGPILLGLVLAYAFTNALFVLMWLNGQTSGSATVVQGFSLVSPNPLVFGSLFFTALLCVTGAALRPARQSSKLSVVEAVKGNPYYTNRARPRSTRFEQNISRDLALDNNLSFRHTFRGTALAMALAGLVFSTVLIIQAHRSLEEKYDTPSLPYNLTSIFFSVQKAPQALWDDLREIGIKDIHAFSSYSFRYLPEENAGFLSTELGTVLEEAEREYRLKVTVYGLVDSDFQALLRSHGFQMDAAEGFLLLDRTAQDPTQAYSRRSYIPLSSPEADELVVVDEGTKKRWNLPITGRIEEFPYELNPLWPDEIALFTSMSWLEEFRLEQGLVDEDRPFTYRIRAYAPLDELSEATDSVLNVLYRYVPQSDAFANNQLTEAASKKEQYRNELLLTISAQIMLLVIGASNAYNSVNMNLRARTRDFALLRSVGMTGDQLRSMLRYEGYFLIRRVADSYILMLAAGIVAVAAKKRFMFTPWQIALHLNFPLLVLFFSISLAGVWAALRSCRQRVLSQNIAEVLQTR